MPNQTHPTHWKNQTVLITGGADGLGFALARRLALKGAHVALLDRDGNNLKKACESLPEGLASAHQVDVTDASAVRQAVESIFASRKSIEALVNCAGIVGKTNIKSHEVELSDFERVFRINVLGCLTTFQAVVPHMLAADYGRVLHIASISGKEGNAGMLAYSTSKAAVIGMTKVQGKEYATTGITVNALAPAVVRTELVAQMPPEQVKYMTDKIPMLRCGELDEFAAMAEFIISPENSFTTGFTFDLSGGRAVY